MEDKSFEKLQKAKIRLQARNPFFSYLSFYIKFVKNDGHLHSNALAGIDTDGNLYYTEMVGDLSDEQAVFLLCHEILHLALLHLLRKNSRDMIKWNFATDLVVNSMLINNNFQAIKGGLIPVNDRFTLLGKVVTNISKKTAEEIYDELPDIPRINISISGIGGKGKGGEKDKGKGNQNQEELEDLERNRLDEHLEKQLTQADKSDKEGEWLNRIEEAYVQSKDRGDTPLGIERYIDKLKEAQVDWKVLLRKFLLSKLPNNQTWLRRSKKSYGSGFYLPSLDKDEYLKVVIAIDTSGSIGKKELTDFISEIIGMAKAYKEKMDMRLLLHDAKIQNDYHVKNGSIDKIKKVEILGGGGTEFNDIVKYINEKYKDTKIVVWLTDGDGNEIKEKTNYPIIWVISKGGNDNIIKNRDRRDYILKIK